VKPVFADTFYWIALLNADDAAHERVVVFDGANDRPPLLTTDEILIEFLTFFSGKGTLFRVKAVAIARSLQRNRGVLVLPQTHESYLTGLDFYAKRSDKGYSLTDCISMDIMRREGLTDVLTNDRHFEQEGFRAVFREG
jgi:predicted nucleic acid-binding protein